MKKTSGLTYAAAGVSIAAGDALVDRIGPVARRTAIPGVISGVGGFSALFELNRYRYRNPVLVISTDGVGTKLKVAFKTGKHDTVGIDLVAMSANDILTQGATPLLFLDYFVCGKLDVKIAEAVIRGIAEGCRQASCALIGGETAEHPGDFPKGEYDLAGFVVGVLEKKRLIRPNAVRAGDVLLGLPSSGLHSNGYSLARKVLLEKAQLPLGRRISELGRTLGEELLEPTRIYVNALAGVFKRFSIKGAAHITGGGIVGNLPRVLPVGKRAVIERRSWIVPPIFNMIQRLGRVAQDEMDRTFNNGLGMAVVVSKNDADRIRAMLQRCGLSTAVIGEIRNGTRGVTLKS